MNKGRYLGISGKRKNSVGAFDRLSVRALCFGRVVKQEQIQKSTKSDAPAATERLVEHAVQAFIYVGFSGGRT